MIQLIRISKKNGGEGVWRYENPVCRPKNHILAVSARLLLEQGYRDITALIISNRTDTVVTSGDMIKLPCDYSFYKSDDAGKVTATELALEDHATSELQEGDYNAELLVRVYNDDGEKAMVDTKGEITLTAQE